MSNTLLPCPFCGGEATISDGGYSGEKFLARCRELSCPAASGFIRKTHDEAIAAWNRRTQPDNKPLTLDELRQMNGEPVWVCFLNSRVSVSGQWHLVRNITKEVINCFENYMPFCDYGKTWLAYRHKPKEEHNETDRC